MAVVSKEDFITHVRIEGLDKYTSQQKRISQGWGNVNSSVTSGMKDLGASLGAVGLMGFSIQAAMKLQTLKMSLKAVTGSAAEAERQFSSLRGVAVPLGLSTSDVINAALGMQAAGMNAKDAEDAIRGFGNAIALIGRQEQFGMMAINLQQIASQSRIEGDEIRQVAQYVPQINTILMKLYGKTRDISVSGQQALRDITKEISKLPPAAQGAARAMGKLQDSTWMLAANLGTIFLPPLSAGATGLASMARVVATVNDATHGLVGTLALGAVGLWGIKRAADAAGISIAGLAASMGFGGAAAGAKFAPTTVTALSTAVGGRGFGTPNRFGAFLRSPGGMALGAGLAGAGVSSLTAQSDNTALRRGGGALGGALSWGAAGAMIGSAVPAIGTMVGAAVGAAIGGVKGFLDTAPLGEGEAQKQTNLLGSIDKSLKQQNRMAIYGGPGSRAYNEGDRQRALMGMLQAAVA